MDMIKLLAAAWIGACLRNENDRKKTIDLFNSLGVEAEKFVKGLFQRGSLNHVHNDQPTEEEQDFV